MWLRNTVSKFLSMMSSLCSWASSKITNCFKGALLYRTTMKLQKHRTAKITNGSIKKSSKILNSSDSDEAEIDQQTAGDFSKFRISSKTAKKLEERGISHLFPIQAMTYDHVYDGCDVIARARTGTGKTLSFVLPLCEKLREVSPEKGRGRAPVVLTLAPTRELAIQIFKEFDLVKSKKLSSVCVYGGVSYDQQESAMRSGLDILVGTPGRIYDHMDRGLLNLSNLRHVVLDEADRMLEMGFQEKVDEILKNAYEQGNKPQTLLFSATMPSWVQNASKKYMSKEKKLVDLVGDAGHQTASGVEHKAIRCPYHERASTIADVVQVYSGSHGRAMVFTSTKKEANELALNSVLKQETLVLHGDINQAQREITLSSFRKGKTRVLVATDVAARGLDIPEVDLVIQTEAPSDIEAYIHRSGRTGRAGRTGVCIVFYKPNQEYIIQSVEKNAGIIFKRIGAPQPMDIIKASANDALKSLDNVSQDLSSLFKDAAEQLLSKEDAVDVLSKALALVSGHKEISSRSLLSAQTGFTTFLIRQNWELRGTGLIWKLLNENYDENVVSEIRGMRLCKDKLAAVFDVPSNLEDTVKNNWRERHYATLETPTELPELEERNNSNFGSRSGGYGYNSNRNGQYSNGYKRNFDQQRGQKRGFNNDNNWNGRSNKKPKVQAFV